MGRVDSHARKGGRPALSIAALLMFLCLPWPVQAAWHVETVVSAGDVGQYCDIALDSTGKPHISFYDATIGNLKYTRWNGTEWIIQTVDSEGDVGLYTSLAVDSGMDEPRIAYFDATVKKLKYAAYFTRGGGWSIDTVDTGDTGYRASLAVDSSHDPHIAYFAKGTSTTNHRIRYASRPTNSWLTETVHSYSGEYDECEGLSLALDDDEKPHIAFQSNPAQSKSMLHYAGKSDLLWIPQTVLEEDENVRGLGCSCSLAFDANNRPGIAHIDILNSIGIFYNLHYAHYNGSEWTNNHLTIVGSRDALALQYGPLGLPRIAHHYAGDTLGLMAAGFVGWNLEYVDVPPSGEDVGAHVSMVIDSRYNEHIAYYDATHTSLKYACRHAAPTLAWTGEPGYTGDGLESETGAPDETVFSWRIEYADADNHEPKTGYPRVNVLDDGAPIDGSPFAMSFVSGAFDAGAIYTYSRTLPLGENYTYSFEATDKWDAAATSQPSGTGPLVETPPPTPPLSGFVAE